MNMNKFGKITFFVLVVAGILYAFLPKYIHPFPDKDGFPLEQKWKQTLDGTIQEISITEDGTILVRSNSFILAVAPDTGSILWKTPIESQVETCPAIARMGSVYLADGKNLLAINQTDGKILWKQPSPESNVCIMEASDHIIFLNHRTGYISALDMASGKTIWKRSASRGDNYAYIVENMVYFPDIGIQGIDLTTGNELWKIGENYSGVSSFFEGILFISIGDEIIRFDPQTQETIWKTQLPSYFSRKFALQGNILLVTDREHINALDKTAGKIIWQIGGLNDPINPVIIGNIAYVMEGFSREIYAFDLQTGNYEGKLHSSLPELIRVDHDDMVSDGNLLLFSMQNFLYAYGQ